MFKKIADRINLSYRGRQTFKAFSCGLGIGAGAAIVATIGRCAVDAVFDSK